MVGELERRTTRVRSVSPKALGNGAIRTPGGRIKLKNYAASILEELAPHVVPIIQPGIASFLAIVGRSEQESLSGKTVEMTGAVVNQEVGRDDALVATENDMGIGKRGEMVLDPLVLLVE